MLPKKDLCPFKGTCWKLLLCKCIIGYSTLIPHRKGDNLPELINFLAFVTSSLPPHIHFTTSWSIWFTASSQGTAVKLSYQHIVSYLIHIIHSISWTLLILENLSPPQIPPSSQCWSRNPIQSTKAAAPSNSVFNRWHCWTEGLLCRDLLQWHQNKTLQYLCQAAHWHVKSKSHPSTHLSPESLPISSYKVPGHPWWLLCIHLPWHGAGCTRSRTSCRTQWAAALERKLHPWNREDLEENRTTTWALSDLE